MTQPAQVTVPHYRRPSNTLWALKLEPLLHMGSKHSLLPCQRTLLWEPSFAPGALYSPLLQMPSILHHPRLTDKQPCWIQLGWGQWQGASYPETGARAESCEEKWPWCPHLELKSLFSRRIDVTDADWLANFNNSGGSSGILVGQYTGFHGRPQDPIHHW